MIEAQILTFESLFDSKEFLLAYKEAKSFDRSTLSDQQKESLRTVGGIEVVFHAETYDVQKAGERILMLQERLDNYSSDLYIREMTLPVSRLRSHKGILKKANDQKTPFFEREYFLDGKSYFGCVAQVKGMNPNLFASYFFDSSMNFINVKRGSAAIDYDKLDGIMLSNYYQSFGLDYARLVLDKCVEEKTIVLRAGGDGGRTYLSAQYFVPKLYLDSFLASLNKSLNF